MPRILNRFRRDRRGTTAVEFALIALPFFALLFAILETALIFWSTQVLETAVADASRQIYTGEFQQAQAAANIPAGQFADKFRENVCDRAKVLINCDKLKIDVRTYTSFPNGVPLPVTTDANGNRIIDPSFGTYQNPGPNQIVVVRAAVEYPVFVSLMDANKSNLNANTRVLMASAAFRTEPFQ